MKVLNDLFDYDYKIYQDSDYFKFSLDSILLAEFVNLNNQDSVLDMCTGNAPIPMILSSKKRNIEVDGVEIQEDIYNLAKESIAYNKLVNSIYIHNCNISDFNSHKKYDIITCNPPYFKKNSAIINTTSNIKAIARHEIFITLEECFQLSKKHLKDDGVFYLVHRPERIDEILNLCDKYKYGISKICFIFTKENTKAKVLLIEMLNNKRNNIKIYNKNISGLKTYKNIFKED